MKRLFLAVAAMMVWGAADVQASNAENFNFQINQHAMNHYLKFHDDQFNQVEDIQEYFKECMHRAGYSKGQLREKRIKYAVYSNLKLMKQVLDNEQYRKYLRIVNVSLRNNGLNLYFN